MKPFITFLVILSGFAANAQQQTAPRPKGVWQPFPPQTKLNTLQFSRLPTTWTKQDGVKHVFIRGYGIPFTKSVEENKSSISNVGFTHFERPELISRLKVPVSKRYKMLRDADAQAIANSWAASLKDSDPLKAPLAAYGKNFSVTVSNPALWHELGKRTYNAHKGEGLDLVGFDIETFAEGTPGDKTRAFSENANLGMCDAIIENRDATRLFLYGGSLAGIIQTTQNRQDGDPYFRFPADEWRGSDQFFSINANELVKKFRQIGGFVGRDQYARRTWDDRSVWQKNRDGSIKVDDKGNPLFVVSNYPKATVTNYGVESRVYTDQAQRWVEMWGEEMDKALTDWRWLCNTPVSGYDGNFVPGTMPYPKGTVDIRPGMEKIGLSTWYRDETEFESGPNGELITEANNRPLNPRATRFQTMIRTLFYHGMILWSDKASYSDFVQGEKFTHDEGGQQVTLRSLAMGQFEDMAVGHYLACSFPKYFQLFDQNKLEWIIPKRFVNKGNDAVGERYIDKPLVWLMKEQAGRTLFATWVYPVQDVNNPAHERDISVWIVLDNGTTSGSWKLHCENRDTGFDGWTLPAGFEKAKPENFRFQFTNLLNQTFTWTGNYNVPYVARNGQPSTPTPPLPVPRSVIAGTGK